MTTQTLENKILQEIMNRIISKKLDEAVREIGDNPEAFSPKEKQESAIMLLEMIEKASKSFCDKKRERILAKKI